MVFLVLRFLSQAFRALSEEPWPIHFWEKEVAEDGGCEDPYRKDVFRPSPSHMRIDSYRRPYRGS